jgi:hypothetical protein
MNLEKTLGEAKFYFKHTASLGVLVTLFVYIYYANAAATAMKDSHHDGNNPNTDANTALNDDTWNYKRNYQNMYIAFGVGIILALTAMTVTNPKTKLKIGSPKTLKAVNNHFRNAVGFGVIVALGCFIYYSVSAYDLLVKAHDENQTNIFTRADAVTEDMESYQRNTLNAEISFHIALLLVLMTMAIQEY